MRKPSSLHAPGSPVRPVERDAPNLASRVARLQRQTADGTDERPLLTTTRVGRGPDCHVLLTDTLVSTSHAQLRHIGGGAWQLRDLGSKNGTCINGRRAPAGEDQPLCAGDQLAFGRPDEPWTFLVGAPCELLATRVGAAGWLAPAAGESLLALPSERDGEALVLRRDGRWIWESQDSELPLVNGQLVHAADGAYRVWLPELLEATADALSSLRLLSNALLALRVSRDEEQVEAWVRLGELSVALPSRVYLYMLLLLARYRQQDSAGGFPSNEAGWRYVDDVARALGVDQQSLNTLVFRARRDLAKLGFHDPGNLVERRALTKQIRLGVHEERIRIETL